MATFRCVTVILAIGCYATSALADDAWIYQSFSSEGSYYNANNHSIPQGAAGYGGTVQQPQPYMQPAPVQQPHAYQYNAYGGSVQTYNGAAHLNPQVTNPNNFYQLQPPAPPPQVHTYVAPPVYQAPFTGFTRRR